MYKVVKKTEGTVRPIADNKTANNLITKELSPAVSLAVIEATDLHDSITAEYNCIYFVIDGLMMLQFGSDMFALESGDSCYITKGEKYNMIGTFKTVSVNQPAFGTPTESQPPPPATSPTQTQTDQPSQT